jgi:type VI secretion system secreted protein Hcp
MAVDFFLKLGDGIKGESVAKGHTDEIQIMSFSWGATQMTSVSGSGGSGAGKADLADLSIMKNYDSASVPLLKALLKGQHITDATLTACKAGGDGKPFIKLTLKELFITSIQTSGSSEIPMESVSFSYNEIKTEYFKQDDKGVLTAAGVATFNLKKAELT